MCTHVRVCAFYTLCTSLSFLPQGQGVQQHTLGMPFSLEVDICLLTLMGQTTLPGDWSNVHVVGRIGQASAAMPPPSLWTTPLEPSAKINCFFLKLL